jgi:hypothetical protein
MMICGLKRSIFIVSCLAEFRIGAMFAIAKGGDPP